jgi:hypothetical protein
MIERRWSGHARAFRVCSGTARCFLGFEQYSIISIGGRKRLYIILGRDLASYAKFKGPNNDGRMGYCERGTCLCATPFM